MEQSKIIKIGISGILCYLIFKKSYSILTSLMLWLNVELRIENEMILMFSNAVCGITSILALVFTYNLFLKGKIPSKNDIYILIGATIFLTLTINGINLLYANYLIGIEFGEYRETYLFQYDWTKGIDYIFAIIGLIYFMWKIKSDKKTMGNTV